MPAKTPKKSVQTHPQPYNRTYSHRITIQRTPTEYKRASRKNNFILKLIFIRSNARIDGALAVYISIFSNFNLTFYRLRGLRRTIVHCGSEFIEYFQNRHCASVITVSLLPEGPFVQVSSNLDDVRCVCVCVCVSVCVSVCHAQIAISKRVLEFYAQYKCPVSSKSKRDIEIRPIICSSSAIIHVSCVKSACSNPNTLFVIECIV